MIFSPHLVLGRSKVLFPLSVTCVWLPIDSVPTLPQDPTLATCIPRTGMSFPLRIHCRSSHVSSMREPITARTRHDPRKVPTEPYVSHLPRKRNRIHESGSPLLFNYGDRWDGTRKDRFRIQPTSGERLTVRS